MTEITWLQRMSVGSQNVGYRELASSIAMVLAVLVIAVFPSIEVPYPVEAWTGVACVVVATIASFAVPWTRLPASWTLTIPLLTLLGFGLFRVGTGGPGSMFSVLIILPIIWIAAEEGVRHIVIAAVGASVALMLPYLLGVTSWADGQLVRTVFSPLIYAVVAAVVNDLAHRARVQIAAVQTLADERSAHLADAEAHALEIQEKSDALAKAEAFNRSIWDAIVFEAVIVTDLRGLIIAWGPGAEWLLDVPADQVEGKRYLTSFLDPDQVARRVVHFPHDVDPVNDHDRFSDLVEAARSTWGTNAEWLLVRADSRRVPMQVSGSPRLDDDGVHVGYIFVGTDVSQAHEVARLKDEFVGLVSHELRTPLSSILGYLELIRDDEDAPLSEEQLSYLAVAERNAHRLLTLVGDLLFTAQVESGKFPLEVQDVDLTAVVHASVQSAAPVAERGGVTLTERLPEDAVLVRGDPVRLGQACDNLVSNAMKFTPRGGRVTVTLTATDGEAMIAVSDTGIGIPAGEIDRLFTRFFRASTAVRQAVQGVGLGLSITKAIVTAHNGRMGVSSIEGHGTTFTITIPAMTTVGAVPLEYTEQA